MELIFRPRFERDLEKIKDKEVLKRISTILRQIENAKDIKLIGGLVKLKKYVHYYRIKIKLSERKNYRLGLMIKGKKVWAERVARRIKIYRDFPTMKVLPHSNV